VTAKRAESVAISAEPPLFTLIVWAITAAAIKATLKTRNRRGLSLSLTPPGPLT